jgi:hypothetical protein
MVIFANDEWNTRVLNLNSIQFRHFLNLDKFEKANCNKTNQLFMQLDNDRFMCPES